MKRPNTPDGLFHDGNPATGEKGTPITAGWLNALLANGAFLSGNTEPPPPEVGGPDDYYLVRSNLNLYGPKTAVEGNPAGAWPAAPTPLKVGVIGYPTLVAANADLANITANHVVWINADPDFAKIGFWVKTGEVLVQSPNDRVAQVESTLRKDILTALLGRTGTAKNMASATSLTAAEGLRTLSTALQPERAVNSFFVSVRVSVTGASYPTLATDPAVFSQALRVQVISSGQYETANLINLPGTDVWYYSRSSAPPYSPSQSIKIFCTTVAGVSVGFSEHSLTLDSGMPFPEIENRTAAIAALDNAEYAKTLLGAFRTGADANLLAESAGGEVSDGALLRMQSVINQTLTSISAAIRLSFSGVYPDTLLITQLKAEVVANGVVKSSSAFQRIAGTDIWFCRNVPVTDGPHTAVKIDLYAPAGQTVTAYEPTLVAGDAYPLPTERRLAAVEANATAAAIAAVGPAVDAALSDITARPVTAFDAIRAAADRRVDIVMCGDSNQLKDGTGWDHGWAYALASKFPQYATPLAAATGQSAQGYLCSSTIPTGGVAPPTELQSLFDMTILGHGTYYLDAGLVTQGKIRLVNGAPLNINSNLRLHAAYGTFPTGAGYFKLAARRGDSPYTLLTQGAQINTNTGSYSKQIATLDIPAAARAYPIEAGFYVQGATQGAGPFFSYYHRLEDLDQPKGWSAHTLLQMGGQSLYDFSVALYDTPTQGLITYFEEVRRLQLVKNQKPIVVIVINSGANDQNETLSPSRGWRASTDPDSAEAYIDNLESCCKRFEDVWTKAGWDVGELYFLIVPTHPTSTPDAAELVSYRQVAWAWSAGRARTSFIDLDVVTSETEITANDWYLLPGDHFHLKQTGYEAIAQKMVNLIVP